MDELGETSIYKTPFGDISAYIVPLDEPYIVDTSNLGAQNRHLQMAEKPKRTCKHEEIDDQPVDRSIASDKCTTGFGVNFRWFRRSNWGDLRTCMFFPWRVSHVGHGQCGNPWKSQEEPQVSMIDHAYICL